MHLQSRGKRGFHSQGHCKNRFAPNRLKLRAISHWLIGPARTAIFRRVHIEESLNHFIMVKSCEKKQSGFAGADDEFSGAIGHPSVLAVLECAFGRNWKSCEVREERSCGMRTTRLRRKDARSEVFAGWRSSDVRTFGHGMPCPY